MVIIFDLDDTLYEERTYVESGLNAVAAFGNERFGWSHEASFIFMVKILDSIGRGMIFDLWLKEFGGYGKGLTKQCVNIYRHHTPEIKIFKSAKKLLPQLKDYPMYILTDGHKIVQEKKLGALGIEKLFLRAFITHRYGVKYAKPSTYCFDLIRKRESVRWEDMIYVGDNPYKDFVNLNKLGVKTVRVQTGFYRKVKAEKDYDAQYSIADLSYFLSLLQEIIHQD